MLTTSKNVLFPGHNHLLTTGTDDPLIITLAGVGTIIKVSGYQYRWLTGGYDLEMGHFQKWLPWWLPGGVVACLRNDYVSGIFVTLCWSSQTLCYLNFYGH